jgi:cell division protein ZapE
MNASSSSVARTPLARYQADLSAGRITHDAAQSAAVGHMQRIFQELTAPADGGGLMERLFGRRRPLWSGVRGLYLWGRVGRGKTYIVDTFFDCLPFATKQRIHFHNFMRQTHAELRSLKQEADPLKIVAERWAAKQRVLCLDEFHVGDITDAMLLANLLESLLGHGVTLIATSNEAPDELYAGGLQRERFLPAIAMIKRSLEVFELAGETDYRLRALEQAPVFYCCAPGACDADLARSFEAMTSGATADSSPLEVEGRSIATVRHADGVAWFRFDALCGGPRSAIDYIEIARCHHTVILADVPRLGIDDNDAARRLINLIDELYDRNVNLIMSAAAEPEALYHGGKLAKPFLRTASRLREMRSHDYLARPHMS